MDEFEAYLFGFLIGRRAEPKTKRLYLESPDLKWLEMIRNELQKRKNKFIEKEPSGRKPTFKIFSVNDGIAIRENEFISPMYRFEIPKRFIQVFINLGLNQSIDERNIAFTGDKEIDRHILRGFYESKRTRHQTSLLSYDRSNTVNFKITFTGTDKLISDVKNYIKNNLYINAEKINVAKSNLKSKKITYEGENGIKVYLWMYKDSNYYKQYNADYLQFFN